MYVCSLCGKKFGLATKPPDASKHPTMAHPGIYCRMNYVNTKYIPVY